jgi:hypothetical protein
LGEEPAEALLGPSEPPALDERLRDLEADVVSRVQVLATGISQSHDQPVDRAAATAKGASQRLLLLV